MVLRKRLPCWKVNPSLTQKLSLVVQICVGWSRTTRGKARLCRISGELKEILDILLSGPSDEANLYEFHLATTTENCKSWHTQANAELFDILRFLRVPYVAAYCGLSPCETLTARIPKISLWIRTS